MLRKKINRVGGRYIKNCQIFLKRREEETKTWKDSCLWMESRPSVHAFGSVSTQSPRTRRAGERPCLRPSPSGTPPPAQAAPRPPASASVAGTYSQPQPLMSGLGAPPRRLLACLRRFQAKLQPPDLRAPWERSSPSLAPAEPDSDDRDPWAPARAPPAHDLPAVLPTLPPLDLPPRPGRSSSFSLESPATSSPAFSPAAARGPSQPPCVAPGSLAPQSPGGCCSGSHPRAPSDPSPRTRLLSPWGTRPCSAGSAGCCALGGEHLNASPVTSV